MKNQTEKEDGNEQPLPGKQPFWKKKWIKGMGIGAFTFFLVKGLIWLAIFFGAFKMFSC